MKTGKEYEEACEKVGKENEGLMEGFGCWLREKQLSEKTVQRHLFNVYYYINHFLLYYDVIEAKDGAYQIDMYLSSWFIRKTLWSSVAYIKSTAASLKKFYTFMFESGYTTQEQLDNLSATIKNQMPEWLAAMKKFDELCDEIDW